MGIKWTRSIAGGTSLLLLVGLAACSDDDPSTASADTTEATAENGETSTAAAGDGLEELVAAATQEGAVTLYSGIPTDRLAALETAFEAEYPGIDVTAVRQSTADLTPRLDVELQTGQGDADVVAIPFGEQWLVDNEEHLSELVGPNLTGGGEYDVDEYVDGPIFEVSGDPVTFVWNTDLVPDGLTDFGDVLDDPSLAGGRIGIPDISISPVVVDYFSWLEDTFGPDFLDDLAALEPRMYAGSLPTTEALASGEISAAIFDIPSALIASQASGAPVDFAYRDGETWGSKWSGAILETSPHPNAAQLLADYMVTPEGQAAISKDSSSVLPGIPGTTTNDQIRSVDPATQTPEYQAEYIARWDELFR